LYDLAAFAHRKGARWEARGLLEEALALDQESERPSAGLRLLLAQVLRLRGDHRQARERLNEALQLADQEPVNRVGVRTMLLALIHHGYGELWLTVGDVTEAARCFGASLEFWLQWRWLPYLPRWGPKAKVADCLDGLAAVAARRGQLAVAARLLGAAAALKQAVDVRLPALEAAERKEHVEQVRAALGEEAFADAWEEGRTLSQEEAVALAREVAGGPAAKPMPGASG
jgi:tetratricopeptide (TPR) repeat protein